MLESRHQFNLAPEFVNYANIKVVGVGGGGGNAINRMIGAGLRGVDFIAVNTDAQVLDTNLAEKKIQIGRELTNGLGAGANPEVGKKAMEESRHEVKEEIGSPNLVFITAGMGGGTGTGAAPLVAEIAKSAGALTVAIVTTPFRFEGKPRLNRAHQGLAELKAKVDTLITIPNERLLEVASQGTKLTDAFAIADDVLYQATKGISDLITIPGLINCDFADVRTVMREMGEALMGTGTGVGDDKAVDAARAAISSPLLDNTSISGARGVLINITGGDDMTLFDVRNATSLIYEEAGADANIIFGAVIDPTMTGKMQVTVIATGLGEPAEQPIVVQERKPAAPPAPQPVQQVATPIPLFPEENVTSSQQPEAAVLATLIRRRESHHYLAPVSQPEPEVQPEPEPEPALVAESETESYNVPLYSPEAFGGNGNGHGNGHGNGNGNGNGNGHSLSHSHSFLKPRVPQFSEEDRSVPAYIRRLDSRK